MFERQTYLVKLEPESLDLRIIERKLEPVRNDLAAEVSARKAINKEHTGREIRSSLVHQPRATQLRHEPITKYLFESPLVMIEPLLALVIHRAYVDDDVTGIEDLGVARPFELYSNASTINK